MSVQYETTYIWRCDNCGRTVAVAEASRTGSIDGKTFPADWLRLRLPVEDKQLHACSQECAVALCERDIRAQAAAANSRRALTIDDRRRIGQVQREFATGLHDISNVATPGES